MVTYPLRMKQVITALKILTICWVALAVTATGLSGMVLCFSAEGHFAFEQAHQGHCEAAEHDHNHGPHEGAWLSDAVMTDCCGDCTDVSLASDPLFNPVPKSRSKLSAGADSGPVLPNVFHDLTGRVRTAGYPMKVAGCTCLCLSPSLVFRKSVALRI